MHKNWIQKTSTSFLLVLFVFIHAVKTFHTHNNADVYLANPFSKKTTVVKASFDCAICDFQIAKDSDAITSDVHIQTPVTLLHVHHNYLAPVATSFAIASDNKGPPSIA